MLFPNNNLCLLGFCNRSLNKEHDVCYDALTLMQWKIYVNIYSGHQFQNKVNVFHHRSILMEKTAYYHY